MEGVCRLDDLTHGGHGLNKEIFVLPILAREESAGEALAAGGVARTAVGRRRPVGRRRDGDVLDGDASLAEGVPERREEVDDFLVAEVGELVVGGEGVRVLAGVCDVVVGRAADLGDVLAVPVVEVDGGPESLDVDVLAGLEGESGVSDYDAGVGFDDGRGYDTISAWREKRRLAV